MMSELDVATVIAETNKQLRHNQQIHPDDPILATVILNEHILNAQISAFKKKLDEALQQFAAISEQQNRNAGTRGEAIADRLIANAGTRIDQQLDLVAQRWEERLKQTAEATEATGRRASVLAWIGAVLIIVSAGGIAGCYLGNIVFDATHHAKQRHR